MNQRNRQKIGRWLVMLVIGFGLSIIAGRLFKKQYQPSPVRLSALDNEPFPGLRESIGAANDYHEISQSLLIDSILTIVRNYYVDAYRLTSRDLLDRALYALTENNDVRLFTTNEDRLIIAAEGGRTELQIPKNYNFEHLASHAGQIAKILDRTRPEDVNKNASSRDDIRPKTSYGAARFLNALLQSLDPHSTLMNREDYLDLRQGTEGSFGGLGVVVGIKNDLLTVIKPLPESPAHRAGIVQDDQIMSINDVMTFGTTLDHLVQHMRGAPGTTVRLSLLRAGEYAPVEVSLKREIIQVSSVEGKILESEGSRILHLTIESFSSRTAHEISHLIARHQSRKPLEGLILDLRSNPGGLLDQAVQVADLFLSSGDIVSTVGKRREVEKAYFDNKDIHLPLLVLINSESASASEIVAGALQDNNRAIVIGQPSFGKGTVQTVFELPGEKALKLTIARYYTPSGRSIQSVGIMPDIWLQPVLENSVNINLMGQDRYRNEQFFNRSLLNQDQTRTALKDSKKAAYKGYFLVSLDDGTKHDFILGFAQQIIEDLLLQNEGAVPIERLRSSYWLANSHNMVNKLLRSNSSDVEKWLTEQFKIDWQKQQSQLAREADELAFSIQSSKEIAVIEGENLKLPWTIENRGERTLGRVSIFAIPESHFLDTHEILVGMIGPNEIKHGVIEIPMNLSSAHQSFRMTLGLAVDSLSQIQTLEGRQISILARDHPTINYDIQLVDERGGRLQGVLEPGEEAFLELRVVNHSQVAASSITTILTNLTGKQVYIKGYDLGGVPFNLQPNQDRVIRFPIKAADQLYHNKLHFGVTIESADLLRPIKGSFVLDGEAGFKTAKQSR